MRYVRYILILAVVAILVSYFAKERLMFWRIYRVKKDDPEEAMRLAAALKDTPRGIALAMKDFDGYGGKTRGISTWMLEYSTRPEVVPFLIRIADDPSEPQPRRFEALLALWRRGNFQDYGLLDRMFLLITNSGSHYLSIERSKLAFFLNEELWHIIKVPHTNTINLTLEEFQKLTRKPGAIRTYEE